MVDQRPAPEYDGFELFCTSCAEHFEESLARCGQQRQHGIRGEMISNGLIDRFVTEVAMANPSGISDLQKAGSNWRFTADSDARRTT